MFCQLCLNVSPSARRCVMRVSISLCVPCVTEPATSGGSARPAAPPGPRTSLTTPQPSSSPSSCLCGVRLPVCLSAYVSSRAMSQKLKDKKLNLWSNFLLILLMFWCIISIRTFAFCHILLFFTKYPKHLSVQWGSCLLKIGCSRKRMGKKLLNFCRQKEIKRNISFNDSSF